MKHTFQKGPWLTWGLVAIVVLAFSVPADAGKKGRKCKNKNKRGNVNNGRNKARSKPIHARHSGVVKRLGKGSSAGRSLQEIHEQAKSNPSKDAYQNGMAAGVGQIVKAGADAQKAAAAQAERQEVLDFLNGKQKAKP